ncbi:MAG: histidine phosphatase family protein [Gammaproteobacteria bacterium]|nr:histidine phosphatase family protein [Gammaproteobacteria bacterium]
MELILIRHGLPERQELENGRADPPLSDTGHRQATLVANWLSPINIDAVYSSPMVRARQTADPYVELTGNAAVIRDGLEEFGREASSYIPVEQLKRENYEAWQALATDFASEPELGLDEFGNTVVEAIEEIIASHRSQTALVFCHGGVINAWASHVLGITTRMFFEPVYTSVHRFLCASTGERNIVSLNETAHLRDF